MSSFLPKLSPRLLFGTPLFLAWRFLKSGFLKLGSGDQTIWAGAGVGDFA